MSPPACTPALLGFDVSELRHANRRGRRYVYERAGVEVERRWDDDLATAQAMCAACPLLASCLQLSLTDTDLQGFAAGMLEHERRAWRKTAGVTVPRPVPVREFLDPRAAQEFGVPITDLTIAAVRSLRSVGKSTEEIALSLGIKVNTVKQADCLINGSRTRKRDEPAVAAHG